MTDGSGHFEKLLDRNPCVPDDLSQQPRADLFGGVNGNHCGPAIRMFQNEVASPLMVGEEPELLQRADNFSRG